MTSYLLFPSVLLRCHISDLSQTTGLCCDDTFFDVSREPSHKDYLDNAANLRLSCSSTSLVVNGSSRRTAMHTVHVHRSKIVYISVVNTSTVCTSSVAAVRLVAYAKIASGTGSWLEKASQDTSAEGLVFLDQGHKTLVMSEFGHVVNEEVCNSSLQG